MFFHINLEIIQRKARHRKIEPTLRYDHVSDDMVKEYFAQQDTNSKTITEINLDESTSLDCDN